MEDSPARNTRAGKGKTQGQIEVNGRHYRSLSCINFQKRVSPKSKANRTPSVDSAEGRNRHQSWDQIKRGSVGDLRNKIENWQPHCTDDLGKTDDNPNNFNAIYNNSPVASNLKDVRCRLFEDEPVNAENIVVAHQSVSSDKITHGEGANYRAAVQTRDSDNTLDKQLNFNGNNSKIGTAGIKATYTKNTNSTELEEEEEEVEVFLKKQNSQISSCKMTHDKEKSALEEQVKVPENVSLVDVYKMLAQFQLQMSNVPEQLTNMETAMEGVKSRIMTLETSKETTDTAINNLETGLQDVSSRVTELETKDEQCKTMLETKVSKEDLKLFSGKVETLEEEVKCLKGLVAHQQTCIEELVIQQRITKDKVFDRNCAMLVTGIVRKERENCKHMVQQFCTRMLGVKFDIPITKAYRVGSTESSAILFYLA